MSRKIIISIIIIVIASIIAFIFWRNSPEQREKRKMMHGISIMRGHVNEFIKKADKQKFLISGTVVNQNGKLLEGVKVKIITKTVLGIMPSRTYTNKNKVTAREIKKYFYLGSCRGTKVSGFPYPIDKGNSVVIDRYPDVVRDETCGDRDPNRNKYFIFLHGFNVNESEALQWNEVVFRRIYWLGFRDNYIGIKWRGDGFPVLAPTYYFDVNVKNAFQTSPAIMRFIKNTLQDGWQVSSSNINIMAHSLGNLVMWDALRLYYKTYSSSAVNDTISAEAAVWEDAFLPELPVVYGTPSDPGHEITYTTDQLMRHSWAFWFYQKSTSGNDIFAEKSITGKIINSFCVDDTALVGNLSTSMINNDYLMHKEYTRPDNSQIILFHYNRDNALNYRVPYELVKYPALLQGGHRTPSYIPAELSFPLGATLNINTSDNFNAKTNNRGWRDGQHSDLKNRTFYNIYNWYNDILGVSVR